MPDLVTHFTAAYLLKRPQKWSNHRVPFYLGAILPDILSRPIYILFPAAGEFAYSIHSPLIVLLVCILLSLLFAPEIRSGVRLNLIMGAGTHFLLDSFQRSVGGGYTWLFPLSLKTSKFGLFWPEASLSLVPLWIILLTVFEVISRRRRVSFLKENV